MDKKKVLFNIETCPQLCLQCQVSSFFWAAINPCTARYSVLGLKTMQAAGSNPRTEGQKSQASNCIYFTKHISKHATETLKFFSKAVHLLCQLLSIWNVLEWKRKIGCIRLLLQQLGCHVTTLCQRGDWLFSLRPAWPLSLWFLALWVHWGLWSRAGSSWALHWCSAYTHPCRRCSCRWTPAKREAQTQIVHTNVSGCHNANFMTYSPHCCLNCCQETSA